MLVVCVTAAVTNNLKSANHLADGKEAEDFEDDNTGADHLLAVHVADVVDHLTWVHRAHRAGHRVGGRRSRRRSLLEKAARVLHVLHSGLIV